MAPSGSTTLFDLLQLGWVTSKSNNPERQSGTCGRPVFTLFAVGLVTWGICLAIYRGLFSCAIVSSNELFVDYLL